MKIAQDKRDVMEKRKAELAQCHFDSKKIQEDRCRAAVWDHSFYPCKIRQCTEFVTKGKLYGPLHENDPKVKPYERSKVETKFNEVETSDSDLSDIYLYLTADFRELLKTLIGRYKLVIKGLRTEREVLEEAVRSQLDKIDELQTNQSELEMQIVQIETESDPALQKRLEELKEQLKEAVANFELKQNLLTNCTWGMASMTAAIKEKQEELEHLIPAGKEEDKTRTDLAADIEQFRLQREEAKRTREISENAQKTIAEQGSVVGIARVRCGNREGKENELQITGTELKVGNKTLQEDETKHFVIWNDNTTNPELKRSAEVCQQLSKIEDATEQEVEKAWADLLKIYKVHGTFDNTRKTYIFGGTSFLTVRRNYEKLLQAYNMTGTYRVNREVRLRKDEEEFLEPLLTDVGFQTLEAATNVLSTNWRDATTTIAQKDVDAARQPLELLTTRLSNAFQRAQLLEQSGIIFASNTATRFFTEDFFTKPEHPKNITIFAIGQTGSGKTTASRSLLRSLFYDFIQTSEDLDEATIVLSHWEVKRVNDEIQLTPFYEARPSNWDFPYLLKQEKSGRKPIEPFTICQPDEKGPQSNSCNMKGQSKLASTMFHLIDLDEKTDSARETKYTNYNPAGSSRSVKITKIKVTRNSKNVMTFNLVDTPGFESFNKKTERDALKTWYTNFVDEALTNKAFEEQFRNSWKSRTTGIEQLLHSIVNESTFINEALKYVQESIVIYRRAKLESLFKQEPILFTEALQSVKQKGKGEVNWVTSTTLDLLPLDSSVVVIGAFKPYIPKPEVRFAEQTVDFLTTTVLNDVDALDFDALPRPTPEMQGEPTPEMQGEPTLAMHVSEPSENVPPSGGQTGTKRLNQRENDMRDESEIEPEGPTKKPNTRGQT
jgi:GTPase SAR1 family protein